MKAVKSKSEQRVTLARMIAAEIIGVMSTTGTTFEVLAEKMKLTAKEMRNIVYGVNREITIGEVCEIAHVLGCKIKFSLKAEMELIKIPVQKSRSHLRLVE